MDRHDLPFSALGKRHCFADLLLVLYPSPVFLTFPSSLPFAPVGLGWLFLIALFWYHFLQPFSSSVNECDIGGRLFVQGLSLF